VWDEKQTGLSVLLSASTKTYRATFTISDKNAHPEAGKVKTAKIGRVGIMSLDDARKAVISYQAKANEGDSPIKDKPSPTTFGEVVTEYIDDYAKPNQRTLDQTEHLLKDNCAELARKKIAILQEGDYIRVCDRFAREGHPCKAHNTHAALKSFLRWAKKRGYVATNVLVGSTVEYEQRSRDRVYSDDEIKLIWRAADQLSPVEGGYVKLLLLLAPRKTALALMRRSHLDNPDSPETWATPHELTKSAKRQRNQNKKKRVYVIPLPAPAQRIIKGLPKGTGDALVFPGLTIRLTKAGRPMFNSAGLIASLKKYGAPNFMPQPARHTIATGPRTKMRASGNAGCF
jgi:integrase